MQPLDELRTLIARHAQPGEMLTPIAGVMLAATAAPGAPIRHIYEPVLAVVAQGKKRTVLNDQVFTYAAGQYLVVSVDLPVAGHVIEATAGQPFLAMGLKLHPATIATLMLEAPPTDRASIAPKGMAVSQMTNDLLEPLVRLLRLLDCPQDIPVLGPMIEREILWRLLAGEQGATVRQIGLTDSRLSQINRAIRWLREHFAEPFRIDELARMAAMSASSFHRHFRAVTAMTPLNYQKQIRLHEARIRLLADAQDVAAVGHDVGYGSPSQFSREYSRMFGAPPGKDSARLRLGTPQDRSIA